VAQLHDEHLTTEQLSAFFDRQLSSEEQAVFDAHMATCQQCQRKLADLRLTVTLLRAMPEEAVPRSFTLSGTLSPVPERTIQQDRTIIPIARKRQVRFNALRRSVRVVSALAAVLALMLIVSGILPTLRFGAGEPTSTMAPSTSSGAANSPHAAASTPNVQKSAVSHPNEGVATATRSPATPTGTPTKNANTGSPVDQGSSTSPVIDLSQPLVRLSLGILVLALSIIILVVTRRRRVARG